MGNHQRKLIEKDGVRKAWSKITDWIIRIEIPLPFSLKWVNSYLLLHSNQSYTIIDPGLHTSEAVATWNEVLAELSLSWKECASIVVTHQHPDHYGLAGYVQQLTNAPVYMTKQSKAYTQRLWGAEKKQFSTQMLALLQQHQTPEEICQLILENLDSFQEKVDPQPEVNFIAAGDNLVLGDYCWEIVHTQGHAYGGVMLYLRELKLLICGDQVLPKITPHVGVVPGEQRPVLQQFLDNLSEISELDVSLVLPGHREPFTDYKQRIEAIIAHHKRRLEDMKQYVESQEAGANAFQCCEWLFGRHLRDKPHQMRFALTETIAHLDYLVEQQQLRKQVSSAITYSKL